MNNNFIEKFNQQGRALKDDEYLDNGIIYCSKCKTARQFKLNDEMIVNIPCDCENAKMQKEQLEQEQEKQAQQTKERRAEAITIPSYWNYTFENDDKKTLETTAKCKKYVDNFLRLKDKGQGILFYGDVGTGKTFYAMCIGNALIDLGYKVKHTSLATVVKQAQDFDNAERHFNSLMNKDLIIIDDLGTERATSFAQEQVYRYIDGWNTLNIPMIITTNYTLKEIEQAAADTADLSYARIYSRILEKCFPIMINSVKRRDAKRNLNRKEIEKLLTNKDT